MISEVSIPSKIRFMFLHLALDGFIRLWSFFGTSASLMPIYYIKIRN